MSQPSRPLLRQKLTISIPGKEAGAGAATVTIEILVTDGRSDDLFDLQEGGWETALFPALMVHTRLSG